MRTIRTKVYKFDELSESAKQTAIEAERNSENSIELEFFNEGAIEQIEEVGFYDDVKLQYSLSNSQGDGLSFSCGNIKESVLLSFFAEILGKNKEKTAKILINNCSFECTGNRGNHYCYASKSDVDYTLEDYGHHDTINCNIVVSKVLEKIEDLYMKLCKDLEKQGYAEIEYQYSDEYITETLTENDFEYLENGKIVFL